MAIVANNVLLPSIRTLACAVLFRVLHLSRLLDRGWPGLGVKFRRLVLLLWWGVALRLGARLRSRLRGEAVPGRQSRPDPDPEARIAPESIALPLSDAPLVSVIVPTYGQLALTLRCLASIQAHPPAVPIEVIVADDAFPGPDAEPLTRLGGVRLLRNEVNLGFIRTCNKSAGLARGAFLLFLNNDTEVRAGWLDRMVEVFMTHADAGIVGSKLIGDDGRLREAGGILWKDGSAWNYGLGGDPEAPEFNYLREVDFCSGASLLVRREVFLDVGGFDEKYVPAYCEDSDLSFRLRQRGLKTWYQPRSEVMHLEGASHGRDTRHGVKAYQVINQLTFLETWHEVLKRDHFLNGTHVPRARDRSRDREVVLVIDHYVPEPDRDAGSRTMIGFIRMLLAGGAVVKFWPFNLHRAPGYTEALQDIGVEVLYQTALSDWLKLNGADLDLVLLSRPDVAEICLPKLRAATAARVAYYGHDLHFQRLLALASHDGDAAQRRAAEDMRALETRVWHGADVVLYPSEEEAAMVRVLAPSVAAHAVIPYGFPEPRSPAPRTVPPGDEPWIVFVAGFRHPPNADAAAWLVREVMPSILAHVPAARLAIVGSHPPESVSALCGPRVSLFENVTDIELRAWYQRARVAVVPLQTGAGVKLKTVEALWYGIPAVLTPVGAQGLPGIADVVPIESQGAGFASAVCELLTDDALWQRQSAAQIGYAWPRFSERALSQSLLHALDIVAPPARPTAMAVASAEGCVASVAMA